MNLTVEQALQQAVAAHKEGNLQDAERLYRAILQSHPAHPDANHNLGVLAVSVNKTEAALPLFKTALEANSRIEQFWMSYINALIKTEKLETAREALADAQKAGVTTTKFQIFEEKLQSELSFSRDKPQQELDSPLQSYQVKLSPAIDLREVGKYKEAQEWLSNFVQHNPANPEALSLLSHVLLLDKKDAEAERVLTAAASIDSELPSVYRNQSRLLLKQSKTTEALEKAQLGCKQSPEDSESLLVLASCLVANQRDLEALPLIEKILKAKSNHAEAYANRAFIKLRAKDTTGAIEDAKMTVSLKPHLTQMWQLLSSLHYESNNLSYAIEALRNAHKNEPENLGFMVQLGEFLRQDNKAGEAITILKQATELAPKDAKAWTNLGVAFQQEKRIADATIAYENALALNPKSAAIASNLGTMAQEAKEWGSALQYFEKALEIEPNLAEVHCNLGVTLQALGRLDEAEASYIQAIVLKPDFAEGHSNLGNTLQDLGRFDEAEASYTQAITLKPDFAEAHINLGNTLKKLRRLDEAEASYTQAIAVKPDFAEAYSSLGITLQELGKLDEAKANYSKAIQLKPDLAIAHGNLGKTLYALGLKESALMHFEKNLQLLRGMKPIDLHHKSFRQISNAKLDHDIEQFEYIASSGYDITKFQDLAMLYRTIKSEINHSSDTDILPLTDKHQRLLQDTYNRPIHILNAPALNESTMRDSHDVNKITENYFKHEFGLTYVDDFLSAAALKSLREFLLGSTIWYDLFHTGGYLGAYLDEGLASPLVLQIADDLRERFPQIFKKHHLTHLWAYKYDSRASKKDNTFKGINIHADMAAINVNFWITPSSANFDPSSGGLVVYNAEAPIEWDFKTYNNNEDKIRKEILKSGGEKTIVPYRENRAVIFNSNLFHETDKIEFKEGYANRRINVTILFGRRES